MLTHLSFLKRGLLYLVMIVALDVSAQSDDVPLWVGETWEMVSQSNNYYAISQVNWTTNRPDCIQLDWNSWERCQVTPTSYFSGTAEVTLSYYYKLTPSGIDRYHSLTRYVSCKDNPVTVTPSSVTLALDGTKTQQLSYSHQNNTYASMAAITYSSSDPTIATVSSSGKVTAKKPGTAKVYVYSTLTSNENPSYCKVTVKEPSVTLPHSISVNITSSYTITPTHSPGTGFTLSWKSSDTSVATVNSSGKVTAKKKGTARITATVVGWESYELSSDYCDVTVTTNITSVTFPFTEATLVVGQTMTQMPTILPNGAEYTLAWSSNHSSVASVKNGLVTAKSPGTTTITVRADSPNGVIWYASYNLTVVNALNGDVNDDSIINIEDVTRLISYLLIGNSAGMNLNNADVDNDGHINISDVTQLIDILLKS